MEVFILAGQSNMAGRGGVYAETLSDDEGPRTKAWDGIVPDACEAPRGMVLRLSSDLQWEEATEPLHRDVDSGKVCGVGPGLVFAAELIRQRESLGGTSTAAIALVPCAVGGTSIDEWVRGGALYRRMIERAESARSTGGTLRAVLWYQGESDSTSLDSAESYREKMEALIHHVREDLQIPLVPFIQVGITAADLVSFPFVERVREAQMAVKIEEVHFVDAKGLEMLPDGIHLNLAAQVQLGSKLADLYVKKYGVV